MNVKKLLMWAAIAFVVYFLITSPTAAADVVETIASGLGSAANSLQTFAGSLTS